MPATTRRMSQAMARHNAPLAVIQIFQLYIHELMRDDFTHYEFVLDTFMLCKDTVRIFNEFKADYPEMFARLKAYKTWRGFYELVKIRSVKADDEEWEVLSRIFRGTLPAALGVRWFVNAFGRRHPLLNRELQKSGLLTPELPYSWFVEVFGTDASQLVEALRAAGKLTAEPGRDWYVKHLAAPARRGWDEEEHQELLFEALKETKLLNRDVGIDWYVRAFRTWTFTSGAKLTFLMPALEAAGYLPALDLDWYVRTFEASDCFDRLHLLEALVYAEVQPDFSWVMTHFKSDADENEPEEYEPLVSAIKEFNMQGHVRELGRDWCVSVFKNAPDSLRRILKVCSLLTSEPGKEWYETVFGSDPDMLEHVLFAAGF